MINIKMMNIITKLKTRIMKKISKRTGKRSRITDRNKIIEEVTTANAVIIEEAKMDTDKKSKIIMIKNINLESPQTTKIKTMALTMMTMVLNSQMRSQNSIE